MAKSKFTISLLGFDQRSADTLAEATSKNMKIVDPISENDTQVVVVDIDGPEGMTIWDEFRQQWPNMPAVVISEDDPGINRTSFAEKPFTVEELIDNITEAIILSPSTEEVSETASEETTSNETTDEPLFDEPLPTMETSAESTEEDLDKILAEDSVDELKLEEESTEIEAAIPEESLDELAIEEAPEDTDESLLDEPLPTMETSAETTEEDLEEVLAEDSADELKLEEETTEIEAAIPEEEPETASEESDTIIDEPAPDKELPALSKIAGSLSSRSTFGSEHSSRKLDIPNPQDNSFNPESYIIGLVLKGIAEGEKTGAIAKMSCLLDRAIYVDVANKIIRSNLKDIHMRQIAIAPLGKGENGLDTELEMIDSISPDEIAGSEGSVYPIETFVWELAVLTSKGRAPTGTPMDEPMYLMQWPNFTRLMQIPNAMKVAAYWLRMPSSLNDLSKNLDVPMNDILSFYSAASLTGLAGSAKRNSDRMLRPSKPETHTKRNLFGNIMNSLKKS